MLLLVALVVLAFIVRLYHLRWGLPEIYEEATPVREAVDFWGGPGQGLDLNPHFFKYPSFSFYLHFALQSVVYLWLSIMGKVGSLADFRQLLDQELFRAVYWGRVLSAGLGALTVIPTYILGRQLGRRTAGLAAALLIAVLPLAVLESQFVSPDVVLLVAAAACLTVATRFAEHGRRSDAIVCGVWLGLATASKYPGAFLIVALWTAHAVFMHRRGSGPGRFIFSSLLFQSLVAAGVTFLLATPYVLLDFRNAWADVSFERRHMLLGHLGREGGRAWDFYFLHALPQGVTVPIAVTAIIGALLLVRDRARRGAALPGVAFAIVFLGVLGSWKMAAPRYVLPLVPLFAAWSAVSIDALLQSAGRLRALRFVPAVLAALILVLPALASIRALAGRGGTDSRAAAMTWIEANVPQGASLLVERYGPEPDPSRYTVAYLPFHGVRPHIYDAAYVPALYGTFEYLVLSSGVNARYLADIREYPVQAAFYRKMETEFEEVARFGPSREIGPEIRILKRSANAEPSSLGNLPDLFFTQQRGNTPLAEYFSALGTTLVEKGQKDLGFRLLQEAVDMDAKNVAVWGNLGAMRLQNAQLEEALGAFRRAQEIAPKDADVLYNLGVLYGRMGEARQSAESLQQAIAYDPSLEAAYLVLARVLVEDDRYEGARLVLREFLVRFPRSADRTRAEKALQSLEGMGPGRRG